MDKWYKFKTIDLWLLLINYQIYFYIQIVPDHLSSNVERK